MHLRKRRSTLPTGCERDQEISNQERLLGISNKRVNYSCLLNEEMMMTSRPDKLKDKIETVIVIYLLKGLPNTKVVMVRLKRL